jgi:hypothetical protein
VKIFTNTDKHRACTGCNLRKVKRAPMTWNKKKIFVKSSASFYELFYVLNRIVDIVVVRVISNSLFKNFTKI